MVYRKDIDGLRALAVLPVILFHANFSSFQGGYIGVDVFFVISGFLITSILLEENRTSSFSILRFYERRIKRLLPALLVVLIVSIVLAWIWILPEEFIDFSKSLISVVLFVSNLYFRNTTNYFALSVDEKPLLHTWSLSVEEQFYLFFPLLISFFWKRAPRWLLPSLVLIFLLSFTFGVWGTFHLPEKIFYDTRARVWELILGSFAAFYLLSSAPRFLSSRILQESGALLGLGMIFYSIFFFSKSTPFPGFHTLVPTIGTVLIILFSSPQTITAKILGCRVLVGIGLLSYSAYLWHQPLFAFARIRSITPPGPLTFAVLTLLTFLLAFLTWRYVENPFRSSKVKLSRKNLFQIAFTCNALLILFGSFSVANGGFIQRLPSRVLQALKGKTDNNPRLLECRKRRPHEACLYGPSSRAQVVFWGDSHADQLVPMMEEVSKELGFTFAEYMFPGCPPLLNIERSDSRTESCALFADEAIKEIVDQKEVRLVVLHAYWQHYLDELNLRSTNEETVSGNLTRTVDSLRHAGKKVLIIYSIPKMQISAPKYLLKLRWFNESPEDELLYVSLQEHLSRTELSRNMFTKLHQKTDEVFIFDPADSLCRLERCSVIASDKILYRDDNHLSVTGSMLLKDDIIKYIKRKKLTE